MLKFQSRPKFMAIYNIYQNLVVNHIPRTWKWRFISDSISRSDPIDQNCWHGIILDHGLFSISFLWVWMVMSDTHKHLNEGCGNTKPIGPTCPVWLRTNEKFQLTCPGTSLCMVHQTNRGKFRELFLIHPWKHMLWILVSITSQHLILNLMNFQGE